MVVPVRACARPVRACAGLVWKCTECWTEAFASGLGAIVRMSRLDAPSLPSHARVSPRAPALAPSREKYRARRAPPPGSNQGPHAWQACVIPLDHFLKMPGHLDEPLGKKKKRHWTRAWTPTLRTVYQYSHPSKSKGNEDDSTGTRTINSSSKASDSAHLHGLTHFANPAACQSQLPHFRYFFPFSVP